MMPLYNGMLPPSMVRRLADIWHDAKHVVTEYGERFPDESVWAEARRNGYTIITKAPTSRTHSDVRWACRTRRKSRGPWDPRSGG
jgi:hypothetical protein